MGRHVHRKGLPMQFDLQFRPASYWDHADPASAILSGIKGQNRRRMVFDFVTGDAPAWLGEIDPALVADGLDDSTRRALGASHPSWMGGEYLPDFLPGEVEIARIVMASVTQDVISVRARRRRGGRRLAYRVVDEYREPGRPPWRCSPASSRRSLTLGQLIGLIDDAKHPDFEPHEGSLIDRIRNFQEGADPEDVVHFIALESDFYPALPAWYEERAAEWLVRARREAEAEDEEV